MNRIFTMKPRYYFIILFIILTNVCCSEKYRTERTFGSPLQCAYIVLYSDKNQITAPKKQKIIQRLNKFSQIMRHESLGNLDIRSIPIYLDVRSLGLSELGYQKLDFFQWIDVLLKTGRISFDTDIVTFTPAVNIPWAHDSHSIGYYYKDRVCFSLEYYEYSPKSTVHAISLMLHKMLHGFGYNHQNINMPALKLLNWDLGFPVNTGLEYELRKKDGYHAMYFNRHLLDVLDAKVKGPDGLCLDCRGLVSKSSPYKKGLTADAYGPYCYDADHDGLIDESDDYFLSSPVPGQDSDGDGIVDDLDLVPWNRITVAGNIDARKINLIGTRQKSEITFSSDHVKITGIRTIYFEPVPVQKKPDHFPGFFPESKAKNTPGHKITLQKDEGKPPFVRIEVHYEYNNSKYYRPYYFNFPGSPAVQVINEREWYYYLRFGADIIEGVNFYDVDAYDANYDGFVDPGPLRYFDIPVGYDWDGDRFPDIKDTLPTVFGTFCNAHVCGVRDSDGDGLADPGCLDFSPPDRHAAGIYFGELQRVIGKNMNYDRSPYIRPQFGDENAEKKQQR